MEITIEQFVKEIEALGEDKNKFDAGNEDFSLHECKIKTTLEDDIYKEVVMFSPYMEMEVRLDFDTIAAITKEDDGSYRLKIDSRIMPDVIIRNIAV